MDKKIEDILKANSQKSGIPYPILYAVVMTESKGNPNQHRLTATEDSRGLFQINVRAHPDVNSSQLFNPSYNANYAMGLLKPVYQKGVSKGLTGSDLAVYVERYGERPKWTPTVESEIRKHYSEINPTVLNINGQNIDVSNTPELKIDNTKTKKTTDGGGVDIKDGTKVTPSNPMFDFIKLAGVEVGIALFLIVGIVILFGINPINPMGSITKNL